MGAFSEMDIDLSADNKDPKTETAGQDFKRQLEEGEGASTSVAAWSSTTPPQEGASDTPLQEQDQPAQEKTDQSNNVQTEASSESEQAARQAHEEAEAKRKEEWEAKQAAKRAAQEEQLRKISEMSEEELIQASAKRITDETERLTRRNMKEYVAEYLQTLCLDDLAFARLTMDPRKSYMHCIWYINRKAREYLEKEMEANGMQRPFGVNGMYGGDVPDDLVYNWAEEYYRTPDAEEDEEPDEKFTPKPYTGPGSTKSSGKSKAKQKKPEKTAPAAKVQKKAEDDSQISLGAFLQNVPKAG